MAIRATRTAPPTAPPAIKGSVLLSDSDGVAGDVLPSGGCPFISVGDIVGRNVGFLVFSGERVVAGESSIEGSTVGAVVGAVVVPAFPGPEGAVVTGATVVPGTVVTAGSKLGWLVVLPPVGGDVGPRVGAKVGRNVG